jgi:predicted AlkP superfamily pyrophosphatase or phosphodiesterase
MLIEKRRSIMNFRRNILVVAAVLSILASAAPALAVSAAPRLVLQITVDALRGDLPTRYYDRLGENGFRYLWENGTVYSDAHHAHANTETIVGHTTLATGAHPAAHGMIGNVWFDRTAPKIGPCTTSRMTATNS